MGNSRHIGGETRKGENLIRRKNGNYFYHFGETKGQRGIGFYVKGNIWDKIGEIESINERIELLKIDYGKKMKVAIIQVYVLTLQASDTEKDLFFDALADTIIVVEQEYYTIVMGDFNAKTGKQNSNSTKHEAIEQNALEVTNVNGERVVQLANTCRLKIAGTFFSRKKSTENGHGSVTLRTK